MGVSPPPSSRPNGPRRTPRPVPGHRGRVGGIADRPSAPAPLALDARPVVPSAVARRAALHTPHRPVPTVAGPGYLPALDGLRALSVFAVVAYHLGELSGGFLGVDIFFVISGFLITRLLLAEHERAGRIGLAAFWGRRFRRLLPALLVVLVAVAIGSRWWLPPFRLAEIRLDAFAALAYVANWRFVLSGQSYFASGIAPSPLRHTWSLSIEEQFYLLWPLVVAALAALSGVVSRVGARRLVAAVSLVGAVSSAMWMAVAALDGRDLSRIYYGTDTRAFALFAGAWLASWWDGAMAPDGGRVPGAARWWSAAGTIAVVPVVVAFALAASDDTAFYQGGFQAMAVVSVVLVAGAATGSGPLARVLAAPALVWLGRRSYGIYLWSWPVQVFASEGYGLEGGVLAATVVASSVALAALSHRLVEEPIRTGTGMAWWPRPSSVGRSPRRLPRFAASAGAVALVVAVIVGSTVGAPPAPEYTTVSDEEALAAALGPEADGEGAAPAVPTSSTTVVPIDEGPPGPFTEAPSLRVDPRSSIDPRAVLGRPLDVMITGDSVGFSLGWQLPGDELTDAVALSDRAIIGCGLMPPEARFIVGGRDPEPYGELCERVPEAEERGISAGPDVALLWIGAWEVYDHELDGTTYRVGTEPFATFLLGRMQQRIDRYRAAGLPTVMAMVPCFGPNAARLGDERHDAERIAWVNGLIRTAAKRNRGWVRTIDPTTVLCDRDGEAIAENDEGIALRSDGAHFDTSAAVWFWNTWLAGQLGAALDVAPPSATATTTTADTAVLSSVGG